MPKRNSLFILLFSGALFATAQQNFLKSYNFIHHLKELNSYEEGILFIEKKLKEISNVGQTDTLNYLKGVFQYNLKNTRQSVSTFSKVGKSNSTFWFHANFLKAFQMAHMRNYDDAEKSLGVIQTKEAFYNEIKNHELAGISLLKRDFEAFENYSRQFSEKYYQLSQFQDQLKINNLGLLKGKRKSPLLAGLMSGIVPGSGKFYVGKIGEGYITLLLSTILALQTIEGYRKDGSSSIRFKLFAGLFSTLYIANIWGSVLSVKIYKDDVNDTFDEAILLNMHVPLRTIFN